MIPSGREIQAAMFVAALLIAAVAIGVGVFVGWLIWGL